ncbi:MAG TPA: DUF2306 domain-containing protein [Candidatus Limnocylindrales bacterium]|nr:DUF2306 domain-containing protein [Candidatus Limnocylindrales bacterium]
MTSRSTPLARPFGSKAPGDPPAPWPWLRWLMTLASAAIAVYASQYFFHRPEGHFGEHFRLLLGHVSGGSIALLFGPWQFSDRLRARALGLHRWFGRIYLAGVALGSIAGFGLALFSDKGLPTHLGFGILAVLWFATGLMAYVRIRQGEVQSHRDWMTRNFALTLAAVTLRIYLPLSFAAHVAFAPAYITISWLCWVPNLLVAEWLIRRRARLAQNERGLDPRHFGVR